MTVMVLVVILLVNATVTQGMPVELSFQLSPVSGMTPEQAKAQAETQALAGAALAERDARLGLRKLKPPGPPPGPKPEPPPRP